MKQKPVIVLGAGGHSKVLIDALQRRFANILGITDSDKSKIGKHILGVPIIGNDDLIRTYSYDSVELINGIGMVGKDKTRQKIFDYFKVSGYSFASVIHDSAILSSNIELSEGVQIMAGVVIQPGCKIGADTIINSRAIVDHDTLVGAHVHIAPGVILSGAVEIGDGTLIGTGASIIQGIKIGTHAIVASGATVIRDVLDGTTVMGVPARVVKK